MRNVVVLAVSGRLILIALFKFVFAVELVVFTLVGEAVFSQVLVHRQLDLLLLVGVEHKFNFAKSLKAVQCSLMELKKTDSLNWVGLVEIDGAALLIELHLARDECTGVASASSLSSFFFLVHDHAQ